MSRRLIVLSPGIRGKGIVEEHARHDAVLRRIETGIALLGERRPFERDAPLIDPLRHVFEDGTSIELDLRSRDPSSRTYNFRIVVEEHPAQGDGTTSLDLNCMHHPAPHLPTDPTELAITLTRMARACLDTMIGNASVQGRFSFKDAMAGYVHSRILAGDDGRTAAVVGASVATASPWSDAFCDVMRNDGTGDREACPELQATTMLVMAHGDRDTLLLTPACETAFADEIGDPVTILRLSTLTASLPARPPGDPTEPDLPEERPSCTTA